MPQAQPVDLPESSALENWISPQVLQMYERGELKAFQQDDPYCHYVIPNLLRGEVFQELRRISELDTRSDLKSHPGNYGFKAVADKRLYHFIFGREWRTFLHALTGLKVQVCARYPYPQLYRFQSNSKGLGRHTDFGSGRDLATFLYLNSSWSSVLGGKLELYRSQDETAADRFVEPFPNCFVAMPIFKNSWHAVEATQGNWERLTLILDYAAST
jgi:hypothetical protein